MKIEQLIVQYLYHNKQVSVQDIGSFTISPEVAIPGEKDRDTMLPEGAIQFHYNPREQKDEGLIDYIVDQTRKIRFLAMSDLESYSNLSRQFLNIGKPLEIPGLGALQKSQEGGYEFVQARTMQQRMEKKARVVEEKKAEEVSFSTPAKQKRNNGGVMAVIIVVFLIAVAAAAYYLFNSNGDRRLAESELIPVTDSLSADTMMQQNDTAQATADTTAAVLTAQSIPDSSDGSSFKIVLKDYNNKAAADKAFEKLTNWGHKLVIGQKDANTYQVMMPFNSPLSDTTRARDSLRRFFGGTPYVKY